MKARKGKDNTELDRERITLVCRRLFKAYPHDRTALQYADPFQLLVAVILSAQCTDARVNMVTPGLFARFSTPRDFAHADRKELESLIRSTGFYHNKAKNIIACARVLIERHNGSVPQTIDELHQLPGVGRKTANVVLGEAFGRIEGIVVDTHVARLSQRLGFTDEKDPVKIERALMPLVPKKKWYHFSHALIYHGRQVCNARSPKCASCVVAAQCPSSNHEGAR